MKCRDSKVDELMKALLKEAERDIEITKPVYTDKFGNYHDCEEDQAIANGVAHAMELVLEKCPHMVAEFAVYMYFAVREGRFF